MKFELYIYGENDEVVKEYKTDHIRYGILEEAISIQEKLEKGAINKLEVINPLILKIFKGLNEEELKDADVLDVINIFNQVINMTQGLKQENGSTEKN